MKRPDRAHLIEITNKAETWIRRCGGNPAGFPVDRVTLRVVLAASKNVRVEKGRIAWEADGNSFTAEPALSKEPALPA
jgi:hypothetical protein